MRYANSLELKHEMRALEARIKKLEAENKRLRTALKPMTMGAFWISRNDTERARKALGMMPAHPKCLHCGKGREDHRAETFHCPQGKKHRTYGYMGFGTTVFEPKFGKTTPVTATEE